MNEEMKMNNQYINSNYVPQNKTDATLLLLDILDYALISNYKTVCTRKQLNDAGNACIETLDDALLTHSYDYLYINEFYWRTSVMCLNHHLNLGINQCVTPTDYLMFNDAICAITNRINDFCSESGDYDPFLIANLTARRFIDCYVMKKIVSESDFYMITNKDSDIFRFDGFVKRIEDCDNINIDFKRLAEESYYYVLDLILNRNFSKEVNS